MRMVLSTACLSLGFAFDCARSADQPALDFFEKKIRPVLIEHCYKCHSAGAKREGGLLLDRREGWRQGGDRGAAIVPGQPNDSLLLKALRYADDDLQMPPSGRLPDAVIADFERWIATGVLDPRDGSAAPEVAGSWPDILASRRTWWSLQPIRAVALPAVKTVDWSDQPIDRFVLARLEEAGLSPAGTAAPRTLIRRLSLVLTGLPPSPSEISAFETAAAQDLRAATEILVDRLLASPHFGERWARHWLDVVRFTETHGNEWNYEVHHAWRYRDYVSRAFNDDLPYDQFAREHIAGDLLPPRWNSEGFNEAPIGTAFFRFGEVNHDDCIGLPQIGYDLADNQLDTLTKTFQSTTVACARCHDHKLDAVSMQDYYALLGVIRSSRLVSHTVDGPDVNAAPMARLAELKRQLRRELGNLWRTEAQLIGQYLLAARAKLVDHPDQEKLWGGLSYDRLDAWVTALKPDQLPADDPLSVWHSLRGKDVDSSEAFIAKWNQLARQFTKDDRERSEFNAQHFTDVIDFRRGSFADWQVGGHALHSGPTRSGEFAITPGGPAIVRAILPAGAFTHVLSDRLNGTLRSPVLPKGVEHISLQVLGQRSSAVRLVSNNCQLNYRNYRALLSDALQWITFAVPPNADELRCFAELMTLLDNPKFPDQLATLGGDKENYRLPWEKAAANPRSYFGIVRAVVHESPDPPHAELGHLRPLFAEEAADLPTIANRYQSIIESAIQRWGADEATDADARWLDSLMQRGLLTNRHDANPVIAALISEYRAVEAKLVEPRIVPGVADCGPGFEHPVFERGELSKPGQPVSRRYLEVLSKPGETFPAHGSGRKELAEQIASPSNPFTARVFVNRVWHHLFGTGIVRSVDDFGHAGELPSHPDLLDHLAASFVADGWSTKRLIRSIVLSKTFQMSGTASTESQQLDPQNRLLQHYPVRRLEAEAIRDAILTISGRLNPTFGGMSVQPFRETEYADRRLFPGPLDGNGRRSIYIKTNLMETPKFLGSFNLPGGKVAQGRRDVTNVPTQALTLLNDPFVLQQAEAWANRLLTENSLPAERLEVMALSALGRTLSDLERDRLLRLVNELAELHRISNSEMPNSKAIWQDVAHAFFNMKEFIYVP